MSLIANTPKPPYYAVIFTSILNDNVEGYHQMSKEMNDLAEIQPGFLGLESARNELGISVSYWSDVDSIKRWKANLEHIQAQQLGRDKWYACFHVRVAKVEREYGF